MKGGGKVKYFLVIQGRLDNLNDYTSACRTNQYKGGQMKAKNERVCMAYIKSQLRGVHIKRKVYMRYKWYEKDRRRDLDNISSFGRKVIQDSLVKCGVLENDGWKNISGFSDEFFVDAKNPRIEVEIEVMDDA